MAPEVPKRATWETSLRLRDKKLIVVVSAANTEDFQILLNASQTGLLTRLPLDWKNAKNRCVIKVSCMTPTKGKSMTVNTDNSKCKRTKTAGTNIAVVRRLRTTNEEAKNDLKTQPNRKTNNNVTETQKIFTSLTSV